MDEASAAAAVIAQGEEQTEDNVETLRDFLLRTAELVGRNASLVDEEV